MSAQVGDAKKFLPPLNNRLAVSLTVTPLESGLIGPSIYFSANDTIEGPITTFGRPFFQRRDSVTFTNEDGLPETYYSESQFGLRPGDEYTDSRVELRYSARLHYRFAIGIGISLGVNYLKYDYTTSFTPNSRFPARYVFSSTRYERQSYGLVLGGGSTISYPENVFNLT